MTNKEKCLKALRCLYIAVDSVVADSVNTDVTNYINELEQKLAMTQKENLTYLAKLGTTHSAYRKN